MSLLSSPRGSRVGLTILWAYALAAGLSALTQPAGTAARRFLLTVLPLPLDLACLALVATLLLSGRISGRRGMAWKFILAYAVAEVLANLSWATGALANGSYDGSWVDVLYFACYPLLAGAYLCLFKAHGGSFRRRRIWLDVATFTLGLGTTLWLLIYGPTTHRSGVSDSSLFATFSYSVGNTLQMVAAALVFMQLRDWRREGATTVLLGAAVCTLVADTLFFRQTVAATEDFGVVSDLLYLANTALLGTAAILELTMANQRVRTVPAGDNVYSFLPVLAIMVAIVMVFGSEIGMRGVASNGLVAVAVVCAILVLIRQASVKNEVAALNQSFAARCAEERLTELVRRSSDLIVVIDDADQLAYVSPAAERLLGRQAVDLQRTPASTLFGVENAPRLAAYLSALRSGAAPPTDLDVETEASGGQRRSLEVSGSDHRSSRAIAGLTLTIRDVTEHEILEARLKALAFYDPLTLLANRALFADRARHAIARISDGATPAVMFIDLDNFKTINDGLGHDTGDRLLCAVAQRIVQSTRVADTIARLGGDEFAVLIDSVAGVDAALATAKQILLALSDPVELDGRQLRVSASIGVCISTPESTTETLLRNADAAMYRAKSMGRSQAVLFEPGMAMAASERLVVEQEIASALERGELFVDYQPIVDLKSGHLTGLEALMRWQHPTRGVVMPEEFIPVAERSGCIIPMTRWIMAEACHAAAALIAEMPAGQRLSLSINLSNRYLNHIDMVGEVRAALEESGFEARNLVLEVTESMLLRDCPELDRRLAELKALGVRLALDDFGTGYSSLAYLHRFPLDVLKIDRSFIQQLTDPTGEKSSEAAALARAVLTLADALGLDTVAEGVEAEAQREALLKLGCATGQGFTFGKPMPVLGLLAELGAQRRVQLAAARSHAAGA